MDCVSKIAYSLFCQLGYRVVCPLISILILQAAFEVDGGIFIDQYYVYCWEFHDLIEAIWCSWILA